VLWARAAERGPRFEASLLWIAALSVAATVALYASTWAGAWLMWLGSVGTGLTASSWNSVGMLAVMHMAGPARAGRASGVVMLGFLAGLGSAPPLFGWTVDETGSYTLMWVIAIAVLVAGTLVAAEWTRRSRSGQVPSSS
jgi:cyanate permease